MERIASFWTVQLDMKKMDIIKNSDFFITDIFVIFRIDFGIENIISAISILSPGSFF